MLILSEYVCVVMPDDAAEEIKWVYSVVEAHFRVYDSKVSPHGIILYVDTKEKESISSKFKDIQSKLKNNGFIATLDYKGGEYTIMVFSNPVVKKDKKTWANKLLLIVTFITTTIAGMYLWSEYETSSGLWTFNTAIMGAITFAVPLMAILGIHELGHYFAAKRHGLNASLPYFIPSIPPFGTFGAFISLREPMPDRKALVDIGAAGPMCGFLATLPIAIAGLYLTVQGGVVAGTPSPGMAYIAIEPVYSLIAYMIPEVDGLIMHPMAFAAWVGFFVTGINLLPIGQLDGGHIARGLLGEKAKWLSYAAFIVLLACVFLYDGWLLFALLIILLGIGHPPPLDNLSKINKKTAAFGTITLLLILVTFVPQPISIVDADQSFDITNVQTNVNQISFDITNTGNTPYEVNISVPDSRCTYICYIDGTPVDDGSIWIEVGSEKNIIVEVKPTQEIDDEEINIILQSNDMQKAYKIPIAS